MKSLLGLPLKEALARLQAAGVCDIKIEEYTAPGRNAPGDDMRVVKAKMNGERAALTVCGFKTGAEYKDKVL